MALYRIFIAISAVVRGETTESFLRHRAWDPAAALHGADVWQATLARLMKFIRFDAPNHDA